MKTKTIAELESMVIKKSNKYVYLSDGTHMSHSDFHALKQSNRNNLAIIHQKEFENSIKTICVDKKTIEALEEKKHQIEMQKNVMEFEVGKEYTDWQKYYRDEMDKHQRTKDKLIKIARKIYIDLVELPILKTLQIDEGIKFIIQVNENEEHRFCFDPYQIMDNFHSNLSEIFRDKTYYTINGGWMKIIGEEIILYAQSGDYGAYDDNIALEACKKIFPNKTIKSFAGKSWDKINNEKR